MDSPRREPVPPFGAWSLEDPTSPASGYSEVFTKARASRLGCMPQDNCQDDYYYNYYLPEETPSCASDNRTMNRNSSRKNFLQYFVCGARTQAVA